MICPLIIDKFDFCGGRGQGGQGVVKRGAKKKEEFEPVMLKC
jgi:hypothetical protein